MPQPWQLPRSLGLGTRMPHLTVLVLSGADYPAPMGLPSSLVWKPPSLQTWKAPWTYPRQTMPSPTLPSLLHEMTTPVSGMKNMLSTQ